MSNLYKHRYITENNGNARVINSNDLIRQKLEEQARVMLEKERSQDSFSAGLAGVEDGLDGVPEDFGEEGFAEGIQAPKLDEMLEEAREEADRILENARVQADHIVAESEAKIAQAREIAVAQGKEEGLAQGRTEAQWQLEQQLKELQEKENAMREEYRQMKDQLEPQVVQVVAELVEKVFHVQFRDKKEILLYLVRNTLESIDGGRNFAIKTSVARASYLEEHRDEILDCVGSGVTLDIIGERFMGDGDCVIETDNGLFECGPEVQLENLVKDIKSLCL